MTEHAEAETRGIGLAPSMVAEAEAIGVGIGGTPAAGPPVARRRMGVLAWFAIGWLVLLVVLAILVPLYDMTNSIG